GTASDDQRTPLISMPFMPTPPSDQAEPARTASTARTKGAVGRLDFDLTPLSACAEPECAVGHLNRRAAGPFVWVIHELVEPNRRRVSNTQVALVIKPQAGLTGAAGFNRLVAVDTAANGERAADAARRLRLHRSRRPDSGLGVRR